MDREYIVKTDSSVTLNVTGGRIDSYRKKEETTSTVRVYRDGKIGIAGALGEVPEAELAPRAEAALALGIPYSAKLDGALEQTVEHTDVIIPNSELIPAMQRLLDRLGRECPRFALSNKILMNECRCEYRNSEGRHLRFADRWLDIGLLFQNRGAGNLMDGVFEISGRCYDEEAFVAACKAQYDAFFTPVGVEPSRMPVVLDYGALFGTFIRNFIGELYVSGASLVSGKLGRKCFSEKLTFGGDANGETHPGACFFDDEGQIAPDFRPLLVENGVLKSVLTSKNTAAQLGLPVSQGSVAEYDGVPSPGLRGLYVAPTAETLAELVPGKAILVVMASGGDTTPDGHFATPVQLAYLLENGRLVGKLPELNIGGDFFDLLGRDYVGSVRNAFLRGDRFCVVNMDVSK